MNNIVSSPAAYGILNPTALTVRDRQGRIVATVNNSTGMVDVYVALAQAGMITIHEHGSNALAADYNRTNIVYTIN